MGTGFGFYGFGFFNVDDEINDPFYRYFPRDLVLWLKTKNIMS